MSILRYDLSIIRPGFRGLFLYPSLDMYGGRPAVKSFRQNNVLGRWLATTCDRSGEWMVKLYDVDADLKISYDIHRLQQACEAAIQEILPSEEEASSDNLGTTLPETEPLYMLFIDGDLERDLGDGGNTLAKITSYLQTAGFSDDGIREFHVVEASQYRPLVLRTELSVTIG